MRDLLLQTRSRQALEDFLRAPSHGLILLGNKGAGKLTVASALVKEIVGNTPYILHIAPDGTSISIDTIRNLREFVRLKTTGTAALRRAIIIEDAHCLTQEAQNAFLKLLEEPPSDTLIVLTVDSSKALLPTITSRAQAVTIRAVGANDAQTYYASKGFKESDITRAYYMSGGQVGLMTRLLDGSSNESLLKVVQSAKQFLQYSHFERLSYADQLLKEKVELQDLLWGLQAVSRAALHQAGLRNQDESVTRWQRTISAVLDAQDSLPTHPLPKLLLTNLSLRM